PGGDCASSLRCGPLVAAYSGMRAPHSWPGGGRRSPLTPRPLPCGGEGAMRLLTAPAVAC
ncbi:MAG: hypothetical protein M3Z04_18295, partial [Chloroflexota bacterium]|nr:hypothetical protein [Chloroflexota bacterium]